MIESKIPSIDLNNSQDIARIKGFLPYQPFSVRDNDRQSHSYYAFLGIRKEDYTAIDTKDKNVVKGVSSVCVEAIYLGVLSYDQILLSPCSQSVEVFTKVVDAQRLCNLKKEVEAGQPTCGLRISGEFSVRLEIKQEFYDDLIS